MRSRTMAHRTPNEIERRARLLSPGGLHPRLAELIQAIDRLELDASKERPMMTSYRNVLRARDAYMDLLLEDEPEPEPPPDPGPHPDGRPYPVPEPPEPPEPEKLGRAVTARAPAP